MIERILNKTKVLEKSLNASWLRNDAISQNIANIDTPGYKRKTVSFEQQLASAMDGTGFKGFRTHPMHYHIGDGDINGVDPAVTEDYAASSMRIDGNNVDIDTEMADLAKNSLYYNTVSQSLNGRFKKLKSVISEGRR